MLPSTDSSLLSVVGRRRGEEKHRCTVELRVTNRVRRHKLCTFIVKQTVVGEDEPPSLPQLQTSAVLLRREIKDGFLSTELTHTVFV